MAVQQVGGDHYAGDYQHWDWVDDTNLGYLEGCATKYLARWRQKEGLKDLRKSRSYITKLREKRSTTSRTPAGARNERDPALLQRFIDDRRVLTFESDAKIIRKIDAWRTDQDLVDVEVLINRLIAEHT